MMLGDMLGAARAAAPDLERWLAEDATLDHRLRAVALAEERSLSSCVRAAVASFAHEASDEDWATLASRLRDSDDPGGICLLVMLDRWLERSSALPRGVHP
ncbi:MAG: hypothetical protein ACOC3D_09845 [Pseudomonadota bacterium]